MDHDELVAGLRKWTKDHDGHVRAAVELLIGHGYWLRHEVFTSPWLGVVRLEDDGTWIDWDNARAFCDSSQARGASVSQIAVLRHAAALGLDLYRLRHASDGEARAAVQAVATATGLEEMLRDREPLGFTVATWAQAGGRQDIDVPGLDDWDTACLERDDRRRRTRQAGRGERHEVAAVVRLEDGDRDGGR